LVAPRAEAAAVPATAGLAIAGVEVPEGVMRRVMSISLSA
jgi:hypothetical protein